MPDAHKSLEDLLLVNYRHAGSEPCKSITQLPREDAFRLAARLYQQSPCPAHRRFGPDFPGYYAFRLETEAWLYQQFCARGGRPQIAHPFYFALERCDSLQRNFDGGPAFRLPLRAVDPSQVSFTYGDSMAQRAQGALRPPFGVEALRREIAACGGDVERFLESIRDPYVCIEAQVWSDACFRA